MAGDSQMVMAGLWAKWKSPTSGEEVLSCTILTCEPNSAMGELHDPHAGYPLKLQLGGSDLSISLLPLLSIDPPFQEGVFPLVRDTL